VVRFAVSLDKTTTAEGVETVEQADYLCAEGCSEMQGYYLGRPARFTEFAQTAHNRLKRPRPRHRPASQRAGWP
jgi:EAL domain-containing protein (putative c-di-GMP-specific phosphodiesterase class I)